MPTLNLERWNKVWLAKPWTIAPVPGTRMIEVHGVRGFLTAGDVAYLFNLAAGLPSGARYLEVGSWLGLSSIVVANGLLANMNLQARIYCVDTWRGSAEHQGMPEVALDDLHSQCVRNIKDAQVDCFIELIRGESGEVARTWRDEPLDLVFIDGDHSFTGCMRDLRSWHRLLKPSGRLLGHDATPGGDVEAAVRQFCRERALRASVCPLPTTHFIWEVHPQGDRLPVGHVRLT